MYLLIGITNIDFGPLNPVRISRVSFLVSLWTICLLIDKMFLFIVNRYWINFYTACVFLSFIYNNSIFIISQKPNSIKFYNDLFIVDNFNFFEYVPKNLEGAAGEIMFPGMLKLLLFIMAIKSNGVDPVLNPLQTRSRMHDSSN